MVPSPPSWAPGGGGQGDRSGRAAPGRRGAPRGGAGGGGAGGAGGGGAAGGAAAGGGRGGAGGGARAPRGACGGTARPRGPRAGGGGGGGAPAGAGRAIGPRGSLPGGLGAGGRPAPGPPGGWCRTADVGRLTVPAAPARPRPLNGPFNPPGEGAWRSRPASTPAELATMIRAPKLGLFPQARVVGRLQPIQPNRLLAVAPVHATGEPRRRDVPPHLSLLRRPVVPQLQNRLSRVPADVMMAVSQGGHRTASPRRLPETWPSRCLGRDALILNVAPAGLFLSRAASFRGGSPATLRLGASLRPRQGPERGHPEIDPPVKWALTPCPFPSIPGPSSNRS